MKSDSNLYLYELTDEQLTEILNLPGDDLDDYIHTLIVRFYPNLQDAEYYKMLKEAYKSSIVLEKLYRSNSLLSSSYTAIYTKTGLIRELVNDLYSIGTEKVAIH